jgi:hypothetical protein
MSFLAMCRALERREHLGRKIESCLESPLEVRQESRRARADARSFWDSAARRSRMRSAYSVGAGVVSVISSLS